MPKLLTRVFTNPRRVYKGPAKQFYRRERRLHNPGLIGGGVGPGGLGLHALDHILAGRDEIDGDQVGIDFTPRFSIPATTPPEASSLDHLAAHLFGVDRAVDSLGGVHGGRLTLVSTSQVTIGTASEDSEARDSTDVFTIAWNGALTADITASGVGGLDTGSEAADTWYAVHIIGDTTFTKVPAALLSTSATSPTLPSGYNVFRRLGWIRNNGSSDIIDFLQFGFGMWRAYMWLNDSANRLVLSGGNATGSPPTVIPGIKTLVPPTSRLVQSGVEQKGTPTVSFFLSLTGPPIATLTKQQVIASIGPVDSNQEVFYSNSTPAGNVDVVIRGFYDEI